MSLPTQVIDRLFARLAATYGAAWERSFGSTPVSDMKTAWAHELQGFGSQLEALAWALENLPERAPNVIEFRNLARKAPAPETPRLPEPPADPERVKAELAKLAPVLEAKAKPGDRLGWARAIVERAESGVRVSPTTLRMAKEAISRREVA